MAAGWANYDKAVITLTPNERIRTDAGGVRLVPLPARPPQLWGTVRSGGYKGNDQNVGTTADGTVLTLWLTLIGPVDAMVEVWDTFHYIGMAMEVVNVRRVPDGTYVDTVRHG